MGGGGEPPGGVGGPVRDPPEQARGQGSAWRGRTGLIEAGRKGGLRGGPRGALSVCGRLQRGCRHAASRAPASFRIGGRASGLRWSGLGLCCSHPIAHAATALHLGPVVPRSGAARRQPSCCPHAQQPQLCATAVEDLAKGDDTAQREVCCGLQAVEVSANAV